MIPFTPHEQVIDIQVYNVANEKHYTITGTSLNTD